MEHQIDQTTTELNFNIVDKIKSIQCKLIELNNKIDKLHNSVTIENKIDKAIYNIDKLSKKIDKVNSKIDTNNNNNRYNEIHYLKY